ncbi:MAG: helix-turn-helix domain-containing protein [Candidatus Zixiibacteriota bacterium]
MRKETAKLQVRFLVVINQIPFYLRGREFEYLARLAAHRKRIYLLQREDQNNFVWQKLDGWMHLDNLVDHCPALRHNVSRYIYRLRKALGKFGEAIENDKKRHYRLNWPGENIDFDSKEIRKYPYRAIMDIGLADWKEREKRCIKA